MYEYERDTALELLFKIPRIGSVITDRYPDCDEWEEENNYYVRFRYKGINYEFDDLSEVVDFYINETKETE